MFSDQQSPTDKLNPLAGGDKTGKAKDNIVQITDMMGRKIKIEFGHWWGPYDCETDAQYCKATEKTPERILVAEEYSTMMEQDPALLEPVLAHERVHAVYQSDDPTDEASLQAYVDEEMAAYRAEYNVWQKIKEQYTSPEGRAALDPAGRELVTHYEVKMNRIEEAGWDNYRAQLEQEYRRRMESKR